MNCNHDVVEGVGVRHPTRTRTREIYLYLSQKQSLAHACIIQNCAKSGSRFQQVVVTRSSSVVVLVGSHKQAFYACKYGIVTTWLLQLDKFLLIFRLQTRPVCILYLSIYQVGRRIQEHKPARGKYLGRQAVSKLNRRHASMPMTQMMGPPVAVAPRLEKDFGEQPYHQLTSLNDG